MLLVVAGTDRFPDDGAKTGGASVRRIRFGVREFFSNFS